ncbi:MAG TPA: putative Ig domain-containing protein, partial [Gemmatimonadales bacterium]
PGGLTVAPTTGVVSGTPFESGIFPVTISLTHSSTTVTVDCTFRVYAPGTLRANCNDPEPATIGVAYEHSLGAAGGRPPYIWEITSGSLPTGLSMDSSGAITGTPTTAGASTFTGRVTDADDTTASVTCSITVETPNSQGGSEGVCEVDDQGGPG